MARTVEEGFREFLTWLTPTPQESLAAASHRASIKACLEQNFGLIHFFRTGSFGNGTSISGFSDVDYFACIPTQNLKANSDATLAEVRDALDKRFPNTGVRVNCPAVKVPFGRDAEETTEVVPADYVGETSEGYRVYEIPDCSGGWMRSSPDAHNAYVRVIDNALGNKVKPLIRFIKAWKYYRQVPIRSFYLELRVAKYASGEQCIIYDIDVYKVLRLLEKLELASMQDPQEISGCISPCSTPAKLEEAKSKLATAVSRAEKAVTANQAGKISEAFAWWALVFGEFPKYTP